MNKLISDLECRILSETDVNQALEIARQYGNLLWFADIGIYDAPTIENHLINQCLNFFENQPAACGDHVTSVVHVISEPLLTGGHTRLMEKLAGMHEESVDLIISRQASMRAELRVSNFFSKVLKVASVRPIDIVIELVNMFRLYEKIILHIHPDDIYAVAACGVVKRLYNKNIFFVNHADHVFTYGSMVADYYFELSSYGKRLDSKKTILGKKTFLGIPVHFSIAPSNLDFKPSEDQQLLFVSAGSDVKYKPNKGSDIFELVSRILEVYNSSKFLIIGSNLKSSFWFWALKLKYGRRLDIRSHLEFDEYNNAVAKADFYVDSHPIPGGTAFAEQYLGGRRCVGLVSPIQGYSPADKLKRISVDEVLESISDYKHSDSILAEIISVNGVENVKHRYLACISNGVICENMLDSSNAWTGDVAFFKKDSLRLNADVSVNTFCSLYGLGGGYAVSLFRSLTLRKQIKLLVKLVVSLCKFEKKAA
ncbi:hypothetical protein [Pseudomonas sp. Ant30-3]|uniref:hypothetical protein n=1 Tax=Pseudomonas sp. Ant30-3 TaxID=1488328 RepID=UPI00048CAE0B|nr:hypothetical protein [Pseudomonas sp. Ant30-3]